MNEVIDKLELGNPDFLDLLQPVKQVIERHGSKVSKICYSLLTNGNVASSLQIQTRPNGCHRNKRAFYTNSMSVSYEPDRHYLKIFQVLDAAEGNMEYRRLRNLL